LLIWAPHNPNTNNRYTKVNIKFSAKKAEVQTKNLVTKKNKNSWVGRKGDVANLCKGARYL
jgi:hypothetical protein